MTDEKTDTFGERLRQVREGLGLTRAELAVLAGVSGGTIKSIEFARPGTGPSSALQVLSAIVKKDPKGARWITQAADAPPQALEVVERGATVLATPPPIGARMRIVRRGTGKELSIRLDWEATAQLIQYVAWQELSNPQSWGLAVTISVAGLEPGGRV